MKFLGITFILLYCCLTFASFFVPNGSINTTQMASHAVTQTILATMTLTSSSSLNQSDATGNVVDLTGSTISITPTGRPVVALLQSIGDGSICSIESDSVGAATTTGASFYINFVGISPCLGAYQIVTDAASATLETAVPGSSLSMICSGLTAGVAVSIKMQMQSSGTSNTARVNHCKLIAYEL